MADSGSSPDEAFQLLVRASQRENRKLRDIAADIVSRVPSARHRDNRPRSFLDREHPGQLQQSEEPAYRRAGHAQHQPAVGIPRLFSRLDQNADSPSPRWAGIPSPPTVTLNCRTPSMIRHLTSADSWRACMSKPTAPNLAPLPGPQCASPKCRELKRCLRPAGRSSRSA
jgi:hypothetical protein